jgi:hypothetical protein
MIGIYINFNSAEDFERIESKLQEIGYEVGGSDSEPCWKLCEYGVDGEDCGFTEEECQEIRRNSELLLLANGIEYSITTSS